MSTATATRTIYNPVQRDWATYLETVEESEGAHSRFEVVVSPGGGNVPHRHLTYSERFEVLEGTLSVRVGDDWHLLGPGQSALVEPGTAHCFANETGEPVRFLIELAPGHRGFEVALQVIYGLSSDGLTNQKGIPSNPLHLALVGEWAEMRVTGPLGMAAPLFRLLARVARRRGIDQALVERYVRI